MGFPRASINNYEELVRKLVHQFTASRHKKMFIPNVFNILQGPLESLRDYLVCFNETTIKLVPLNQEIFVRAFHNKHMLRHLNESLAQKLSLSLAEVVARAECYIICKERNAENKARGGKERVTGAKRSHPSKKNIHTSHVK